MSRCNGLKVSIRFGFTRVSVVTYKTKIPVRSVIRSKQFDNEQTAPVSWEERKDTRYCSKDQGL